MSAYAFKVHDDSMSPEYPMSSIVYADETDTLKPGRAYLIGRGPNEAATLCRVSVVTAKTVIVLFDNSPAEHRIRRADIGFIAYVFGVERGTGKVEIDPSVKAGPAGQLV